MSAKDASDPSRAKYVVDTNIFINFWVLNNDEPFGKDVHSSAWTYLEGQIEAGLIIAPSAVKDELIKHGSQELIEWVDKHDYMFIEIGPYLIQPLKEITDLYPIYKTKGSLTDSYIVALAKFYGLAVITSEKEEPELGKSTKDPKIPNVCNDVKVIWYSATGYFRAEKQQF